MLLLNGEEIKFGSFPNNETYLPLKDLKYSESNDVKLIYEKDSDFFELALVKTFLDSINSKTTLYLVYMPHSRMDRPNGHYAISLIAACTLINSLRFDEVVVREPHSNVTMVLLHNSKKDDWCLNNLDNVLSLSHFDTVFFPDFGAKQRYSKFDGRVSYGKKTRDFLTGEIKGLEISGDVGENVLIIDDLCSRGGTFVEASKELKKNGAKNVSLFVSYVEDNVFTGEIFDHIDKIYTSKERELRNHHRIIKIG